MTIQEAIKSGKIFRRKSSPDDIYVVENNRISVGWIFDYKQFGFVMPEYSGLEVFEIEDICADDWEIVEEEAEYDE